ncbi:extracellular solute-binding protein [Bradyrhizobium sp. CCGUVB1N3]|uniref:extracellular solute-binding protein n=1 Tax=Bradyrhizobium sp. CCGUVB1N3 TaxID=2949629 RepID=UPI0020B42B06|nr:extracellular solute-binding protein [Bradyrhizobium sp. CCGUVB1N3]MCP3474868.1 extracellular solute-binding protein [Bradyrhizobium sp. CCGUVB1N3]
MVNPVGRFGYMTLPEDRDRPATSGRRSWMSAALLLALAVAVPVFASPASAEKLTIWSGWPDLTPFYKRVGDQLKSKYPDLEVSVEAIALREHEKRLALSLPSGAAGDVIEMEVEAARYLEAGVIQEPPILYNHGGTLLEEKGGKWRAAYASEAGRNALKQYLDNVVVYRTVTPEMKADAEAFELGQTTMFIRESWVIGDIAKKAPNLKYATAPLPKGTLMVPVDLYVPNKGPKNQIAWDFVQKASEPENLLWLLENTAWVPNRKGLDYAAVLKKIPQFGAFVNVPADYAFFTVPAISPASEILTRLAARLEKAFTDKSLAGNDAAIDAFLKSASEESDKILAREDLLAKP